MNQVINTFITGLNNLGQGFWAYAAGVFIQASVLIVFLLILDVLLRKRVRAVFRYCLWMLLFIKLVLPASFTLPSGIGYWLGDYFPSEASIAKLVPHIEEAVPIVQIEEAVPMLIDIPQWYVLDTPTMSKTAPTGIELESISWQGLVFLGWLVGMLVLLALLVRRFYFVRGLIAKSRPANMRSLEMLQECCCLMGIRRNVELRLSGNKLSPAVCGLFKPVILMPAALLQKISREKLRAVLIHELAHVKRGDAWINLLQTMLQIVYFYNPLVWLANAMIRRAREQAVDEMVLVTLRPETKNYSNMLIDIAEMAFWRPNFSLRIIGVVESKKALERRINHMLTRPVPKSSKLGYFGLIAIVAIGAILLPMGRNSMAEAAETKTIIPGVRVGDYTFDMSKDEVLRKLGEPEAIHLGEDEVVRRGEKEYNLNNLPEKCMLSFGDVSFWFDDSVKGISVRSPIYKLSNGLGVGDSEQKIKQAFGEDFQPVELLRKSYFCYTKGVGFAIDEKYQTVAEIIVFRPEGDVNQPEGDGPGNHIIVPGIRIGDYRLGATKDTVLESLGEPRAVFYEGKRYTLANLPKESRECCLRFRDISFNIHDDCIKEIDVDSPFYRFANGLRVGSSERDVKETLGENFDLDEHPVADILVYGNEGVTFRIHKTRRTVSVITVWPNRKHQSDNKIVPGLRVGDYTLDMSKDDVLKKLGEPDAIQFDEDEVVRRGQKEYSLDNLPSECLLSFGDVSFGFEDDSVEVICVRSPLYKLSNGLKVGDSEQRMKQAFGEDFQLEEALGRTFLCKHAKGIGFEIHKKTVAEIVVYHPQGHRDAPDPQDISKRTIVPGLGVGDYTFGMSKDDVLRKLGEPENIHYSGERYTLDNLPIRYYMSFGYISFDIKDDTVTGIGVHSPLYKFTNGLGVGDSEEKIKQVFGNDFQLIESGWKNQLNYEDKGLQFEIRNEDKTVIGIDVYQAESDQQSDRRSVKDLSTIVRQAAEDGRISFKLTTPDEFKAIVGRPTREWTESDDDVIGMEYPGIKVKFFGKPEIIPHTLIFVLCEGRGIDIGQDRPITLRNEGDLDNFGTFWGYSSVDLSRLDLSQKGELLKVMPFDSRTVWPEPDRLPPDFDPKAVMEWGKYPGLRVKQLHDRGITGKGIHVAIIDQPLLLGHIEYKDQLVSYKEIQTGNADPQMHGPPVASILVGKTCGVAPGAILHYWAEPSWKGDYKYRCIALEQIIQFNKGKEKSEQIRVVSVSKGFSQSEPNLDKWKALLEKARQSGIYIVHCGSMGFGAGCRFLEDSDNPANYRLCTFYQGGDVFHKSGTFFTPIDHRTTASHRAKDAYTFWTRSGLSWGAPYYAGVVALGIQANPNLRPDQIDKLLYDSGWDFQRGKLINPVGFVEAARKAGADGP